MSRGLSVRQRQIYNLIEEQSRNNLPTSSLDCIGFLFPERNGDENFRKSIWRSMASLEKRGLIRIFSRNPRKRERSRRGTIGYVATSYKGEPNEGK
jgi:hypothetical protein